MKIKNRLLRGFFNRCCGSLLFSLLYGGAKWKKFVMSISFDMDLERDHKVLPHFLDTFSAYPEIKFDFAVVGKWVEKYEPLYIRVVDQGYGLINHTYSHPWSEELNPRKWNQLDEREKFNEIIKCHSVVKNLLDYDMEGFRLPHFASQFDTTIYPLLKKAGYAFSSSTLAIDAEKPYPYKTKWGIVEFPIAICPKHPFVAFDTYHSFRAGWHSEREFYELLEFLIDYFKRKKLHLNLYWDLGDFINLRCYARFGKLFTNLQPLGKIKI